MLIKQISVFVENKSGRTSEIIEVLGNAGIDISALSLADASEFGVLRLIVDDPEKAKKVLNENGVVVRISDVMAVQIPNKPGGLSETLKKLSEKGLNVEYMYAFVENKADTATFVFKTDKLDESI